MKLPALEEKLEDKGIAMIPGQSELIAGEECVTTR
jgi:hypothetical protein